MRRNRKTTVSKLLEERRKRFQDTDYLDDENWALYIPVCNTVSADTKCYIGVPVDCDDNGEDVIPEAAEALGFTDNLSAELIDDVVTSLLLRKRKADVNELVEALNYYLENDSFITPTDVDVNDNLPKIYLSKAVPDKRALLDMKRKLGLEITITEMVEMNQSVPCVLTTVSSMAEAKKLIKENELGEWLTADY